MTLAARAILLPIALFLVTFQIRFTLETTEARDTFLFIPFLLKPATNTIVYVTTPNRADLQRGDELLAVNGRPYTGLSVYRQELRATRRRLDAASQLSPKEYEKAITPWPFQVTVRSGTAPPRTANVYFANCTCGSLSQSQVFWYTILPPAVAIALGLWVAFRCPQSPAAWLFLAIAVSAAQIAFVPDWSSQWSQSANPLEWPDRLRVPALATQSFFSAAWPAWLILLAAQRAPAVWIAATPILALAAARTLLAIHTSENFQSAAPLFHALETGSTELTIATFLAATAATWNLGKKWFLTAALTALTAAALLLWPAPAPSSYFYWANAINVQAELPEFHRTPELLTAGFTAALLLILISASGKWRAAPLLLLVVPFAYPVIDGEWALWWLDFALPATLACLYAGLATTAAISTGTPTPQSPSKITCSPAA